MENQNSCHSSICLLRFELILKNGKSRNIFAIILRYDCYILFDSAKTFWTHLISFYNPWKHQKTRSFLMFWGDIERDHWHVTALGYTNILLRGSRNSVVTKSFLSFVWKRIQIYGATFTIRWSWEIRPGLSFSRIW